MEIHYTHEKRCHLCVGFGYQKVKTLTQISREDSTNVSKINPVSLSILWRNNLIFRITSDFKCWKLSVTTCNTLPENGQIRDLIQKPFWCINQFGVECHVVHEHCQVSVIF